MSGCGHFSSGLELSRDSCCVPGAVLWGVGFLLFRFRGGVLCFGYLLVVGGFLFGWFWFVCSLGFFTKKSQNRHFFFSSKRRDPIVELFQCHLPFCCFELQHWVRPEYLFVCRAQRYSKKMHIQHNSMVTLSHSDSCLCWCLLLCPTQNVLWGVV